MSRRDEILSRLPQVTIEKLPDPGSGHPGRAHCNRLPYGHGTGAVDIVVEGKLVGLCAGNGFENLTFHFTIEPWSAEAPLTKDRTYPSTPWALRDEIRLVLDKEATWERRKFEPLDAYRKKDDPSVWGPLLPDDSNQVPIEEESQELGPYDPEKHEIIPNGWDHEHCSMCQAHIDEEQPWHYFNDGFLCEPCHKRYIVDGDLDFLADYLA